MRNASPEAAAGDGTVPGSCTVAVTSSYTRPRHSTVGCPAQHRPQQDVERRSRAQWVEQAVPHRRTHPEADQRPEPAREGRREAGPAEQRRRHARDGREQAERRQQPEEERRHDHERRERLQDGPPRIREPRAEVEVLRPALDQLAEVLVHPRLHERLREHEVEPAALPHDVLCQRQVLHHLALHRRRACRPPRTWRAGTSGTGRWRSRPAGRCAG